MIWLAEIGLVVIAIIAVFQFARAGNRAERVRDIAEERIGAYITTLRRTGDNPELAEMTDAELHDILGSAMRRLDAAQGRKVVLLVLGGVATFLASIILGVSEGWRVFAATFAIGSIVLFGLERVIDRATRAPLEARGLDVDRLRLD